MTTTETIFRQKLSFLSSDVLSLSQFCLKYKSSQFNKKYEKELLKSYNDLGKLIAMSYSDIGYFVTSVFNYKTDDSGNKFTFNS